jgi:hypothetical protein
MTHPAGIRYLHLVTDDKFIDFVITQFDACAGAQNAYLLGSRANQRITHVKQADRLTILPGRSREYRAFAGGLPSLKAVFVHSLNWKKAKLLALAPPAARKFWFAWGSDFYGHCWSLRQLFQPLTYAHVKRSAGGIHYLVKNWFRRTCHALVPWPDAFHRSISRFDFCSTVVPPEFEVLEQQKGFRARQVIFNYGSLEATLTGLMEARAEGDAILVGNSSSPTSNHADIFRQLADSALGRRQVIVPLSYGQKGEYRQFVLQQGRHYLGSRFEPLLDFMPLRDYVRLLSTCGTCIFNHERQQALGNILIALWLGAKVFLRPTSPVFRHFSRLGLKFFAIDAQFPTTLRLASLTEEEAARNRHLLRQEYGQETVQRRTQSLLNQADSG